MSPGLSTSIDSLGVDCSHGERHLRVEISIELSTCPSVPGGRQVTARHTLSLSLSPTSPGPGHLFHTGPEGNFPTRSHSCNTQCAIFEQPKCSFLWQRSPPPCYRCSDIHMSSWLGGHPTLDVSPVLSTTNELKVFICVVLSTIKKLRNGNEIAWCLDDSFFLFLVLSFPISANDTANVFGTISFSRTICLIKLCISPYLPWMFLYVNLELA